MKKVIFAVCVLFLIQSVVYCQSDSIGNWLVDMSAGIEAHDKRLFNYTSPNREALLKKQPEFWGTYHLRLNVKRKVWHSKRFSSFLGLGVGYENATFRRPFDHFHFQSPSFDLLLILDTYKKVCAPMSFSAYYELGEYWFISGELSSNFLVFRWIDNREETFLFPFAESTFELDDIQLSLGINYKIGTVLIGLHSRLANFQKIDRVIFNNIIRDPRTEKNWEWNNPLRFDLTIGYTW